MICIFSFRLYFFSMSTFPFLLQVFVAKDIAGDFKDPQEELWSRISKDEYMQYAVEECFYSIYHILTSILEKEGRLW